MQFSESTNAVAGTGETATLAYQRGRLAAAIPLTTHTVIRAALFFMAAKRVGCAGASFLVCIPFFAVAITMLQKADLAPGAINGAISGLFFILGMWLVSSAISRYTDAVTDIDVCHDGLRWTQGREHHLTLWAEIADVDVALATPPPGQTGLVGAVQAWSAATNPKIKTVTITLQSGKVLVLYPDTLSDFVRLAHTLLERHLETLKSAQHVNLSDAFVRSK
jgi:hypothetical protein